ncbi:MAG: pyrroline-5-carboxylate reductase [Firmicutes bacterium]|nr:pyrroline-5-carboxylate reductase [Bacillota bacterium]
MDGWGNLGIIGVGAMGGALVESIAASGKVTADKIAIFDQRRSHAEGLAKRLGVRMLDIKSLAACADAIIVAVKPQDMAQVLVDLEPYLTAEHLIISLAAGISLDKFADWVGPKQPVVRAMPNTPCLVGEGAIALSPNRYVCPKQLEFTRFLFEATGKVWVLPEQMMGAVTGVSGSGPAYVFLFLEAFIEGGVAAGLNYEVATGLALQTLLGACKLMMETGDHPAILKNKVTSPAGTTAVALRELEAGKLRSIVVEAVLKASAWPVELGSDEPEG